MAKKQAKLGLAVRAKAGKNKAFGRALDKLPHGSAARNKIAKKV
jgi:hypothetical protein